MSEDISKEVILIGADSGKQGIVSELISNRELIMFFTWRELKVRYKQTALGLIWVVLQPLIFMGLVQILLLRRIGSQLGVEDAPVLLMLYIGFVVWQYFEASYTGTVRSFTSNSNLFQKVYIPKLAPAIGIILSKAFDFFITYLLLVVLALVLSDNANILAGTLAFVAITIVLGLASFGIGLYLGALNVKYRDVQQALPFFTRLLFLATPIFWPISWLPEKFQPFIYLNPAAAGIQTLREAIFDPANIHYEWLWIPFVTIFLSVVVGVWYFRKTENQMVDII